MTLHFTRNWKRIGAAVAASAAIGLGIAGVAGAAVGPAPITTTTGTGGYDAVSVPSFTNVQSVITANQYGTLVKGGAAGGVGLCATAGRTELLGLVANADNTYKVEYANGNAGAGHCPIDALLPAPVLLNPALAAVPSGHSVWTSVNYGVHRFIHFGHFIIIGRVGAVTFSAQDVTGTPGPIYTKTVFIRPVRFVHADAGIIQDLTTLTACSGSGYPKALAGPAVYTTGACQPVDDFNYTTATIGNTTSPLLALNVSEGISPVASPALVAPNNSLVATSTGPHGTAAAAATAGSKFTMSTGNVAH